MTALTGSSTVIFQPELTKSVSKSGETASELGQWASDQVSEPVESYMKATCSVVMLEGRYL